MSQSTDMELADLSEDQDITVTETVIVSQSLCPKRPACCHQGQWAWLGTLVLWFIVFTVLFWLIYFSLKPSFVLQDDSNQVDTAKVLLAAVASSLILILIIWIIKAVIEMSS